MFFTFMISLTNAICVNFVKTITWFNVNILCGRTLDLQPLELTKNPAIARKSRPYPLRPKPSFRFPVTERKRFVKSETVQCTLC